MFFVKKWDRPLYNYQFKNIIIEKNIQTVLDFVNAIYNGKDKVSSDYNILDKTRRNNPTTVQQRLNRLWFGLVFWIFIAPVRYVMTGYTGFDERTATGQRVAHLIGEEFVPKADGYKGGWQKTLDRDEFIKVLEDNNVDSLEKLESFLFPNDYDDRYAKYYIVVSSNKADDATMIQRFNRLWFVPFLFIYVVVTRKVYYIKHGDENGLKYSKEMKSFLAKFLGWNEEDIF